MRKEIGGRGAREAFVRRDITERKKVEEELRLKSEIIANMSEGVYLIRASDGVIVYTNPKFEEIFGYGPGEMIGKHVSIVNAPTDKSPEKTAKEITEFINKNGFWRGEINNVKKDGTPFWCYASVSIFEHPVHGRVWVVVHTDITERKKNEKEILFKNALLEAESETTIDGILVVDSKRKSILFNKRFGKMWNMPQQILDTKDDEKMLKCALAQLKDSDGFLKRVKYLYAHPDEKSRDEIEFKDGRVFDRYSSPLIDSNGKYYGRIWYFRDATNTKKVEQILKRDKETFERLVNKRSNELLEVQKELEKTKRLADIGNLAATVAHELRNPLGVIRTAAYNIKRKIKSPSLDRHLINIEKKISESDQIINNLLSYSRIRMPHYEKVQIYNILDECIIFAKERFYKRKISIDKKFELLKKRFIEADSAQIIKVFDNILNNAYQSFPDMKGKIEVTAKFDGKEAVVISFKDNGIGIDKEDLERVFEPFFTRKSKGTGLGLTICNELVDFHGGTMSIESEKDEGTTVTVSLPIKRRIKRQKNPYS